MSRGFEELVVWQKAMNLVESVYTVTRDFPADERYGLVQQLRRAAVSIPSNIAEGQGRGSNGDFTRFLVIARGSINEVRTQVLIATRLDYVGEQASSALLTQLDEINRMLNALISSLTNQS